MTILITADIQLQDSYRTSWSGLSLGIFMKEAFWDKNAKYVRVQYMDMCTVSEYF